MSVVVYVGGEDNEPWCRQLQQALPEMSCRVWDAVEDANEIRFAAVWQPPVGGLAQFPNLECVISFAAGVDHVLCDPELPASVPVLRLTGELLRARMREYVVLHVLALHRDSVSILSHQRNQTWLDTVPLAAADRRVGVLGLGELGRDAVTAVAGLGFDVAGWSRSRKEVPGVACFAGDDELHQFLARSEILVNLLPLTPNTQAVCNSNLFAALPEGAGFINAGRGEHVVEADLLAALATGQLAAAILDAFPEEPLPADHPFWSHPQIWVTPHVAARLDATDATKLAAQAIREFQRGERPGLVDRARGY